MVELAPFLRDLGLSQYAGTFADGMRMERKRSNEHVRSVTPEAIAKRRTSIQERGRDQSR